MSQSKGLSQDEKALAHVRTKGKANNDNEDNILDA